MATIAREIQQSSAREGLHPATDYTSTRKHDGRVYSIHIPDLMLPTCRKCGAQTFAVGDDDRIIEALRAQVGLLTPEEIRKQRGQFELTQQELADQLGLAKESISRWETGAQMQSRAVDNLLRLFFESEEVRALLRRRFAPAPVNRIFRRVSTESYVAMEFSLHRN